MCRLNRDTTAAVVGHLLGELRKENADLPEVLGYLDEIERDILENADDFLQTGREKADTPAGPMESGPPAPSFRRYQVNVTVDNSAVEGAPIIYEDRPNHQDLVGRIEHTARFNALFSDFNLIVPGALHRSNGGYLILDERRETLSEAGFEGTTTDLLILQAHARPFAGQFRLPSR